MLVSLVLLGMAAGMMATGLASGHRLWSGEERRAEGGEAVQTAQSLLRQGIERLRPNTRADGPKLYSDVDGDADQFSFIATPPDAERPAAMRRYRVSLDGDGELLLSSTPDMADKDEPSTDQVLLRGVQRLEIDYFGGAPAGWSSTWSEEVGPPKLVRIRLAFGLRDKRVWPDLIVAPAASVDTQCQIDADTGGCRGRT